jgi:hypothetical protein
MGRIRGGLFFFLLMCIATACSGVLGYLVVTRYLGPEDTPAGPNPVEMLEAQLLRGFSNHLVSLANSFVVRVPEGQTIAHADRQWVDRQFRAEVNTLRLRLAEASGALGELGSTLLNAADRLAALAAQPDRQNLRERALQDVKEANEAAENHLQASRADRWLAEPPVIPAW